MLRVLRNRNFALLWVGQFVSMIGDMVFYTAFPFYIYELTGSARATGIMFIVETIPRFLFSPLAGVFVDRWDRRKTMIAIDLLCGFITIFLVFVKTANYLWLLYIIAFLFSCLSMFFLPAKSAILPSLVGTDELMKANSLTAFTTSIGKMIGPPLGGAMLELVGFKSVIVFDVVTFFSQLL